MIGLRAATKLGVVLAITVLAAGVEGLCAQGASQAASESCARASFRVVVDVGHTVGVPGAMSARGIPEYAFNLQLAREIKQALVDAGFEQTVLLITATAPRRGLVERAARAKRRNGALSPAPPLSPRWRISAPPARDRRVSEPLLRGIVMM